MIALRLAGALRAAAASAFELAELPAFTVEPPRDPALGDFASNLPLMLAKPLGRPPLAVAEALAGALAPDAAIASVRPAAPGFLNIRLQDAWLAEQLRTLVSGGVRLPQEGRGRAVEATYTAPPPGRMKPADARQAVWGDVLVRLLRATGHEVSLRHVLPPAWAALGAAERDSALGDLTAALATVGVTVSGWEAAAPTGAIAGGWRFKKPNVSADHEITGEGPRKGAGPSGPLWGPLGVLAPVSVLPAEAAESLGAIVAALGADGFRWAAVSRAQHLPLALDLAADTRETLSNPLFLIPYTHARLAGIARLARQEGLHPFEGVPTWTAPERQQLLRVLSYPDVVADAAEAGAPHRLARYLDDLVIGFQAVHAHHRVFGRPTFEAQARLGLFQGTRLVLAHGLGELLGTPPPENLA